MYRQVTVKITSAAANGPGSGILFQPPTCSYTYVITAKHCLTKDNTQSELSEEEFRSIVIERDKDMGGDYLDVQECHLHPDLDLAVLLVSFTELPIILTIEPIRNMEIQLGGYPNIYNESNNELLVMNATVMGIQSERFEIRTEDNLYDYLNAARDNVEGISGCGIFKELSDDTYALVGILFELRNVPATFNRLNCIGVGQINDFLGNLRLDRLLPLQLSNFESYIHSAFYKYGRIPQTHFNDFFRMGVTGITPQFLYDQLGGRLFLPYESPHEVKKKLNNDQLWSGWIKLLTWLHIQQDILINDGNINSLIHLASDEKESKKRFYYTELSMSDCVRYIFTDQTISFNLNDCILLNSDQSPSRKIFLNNHLQNIVQSISDIGMVSATRKGINIDDPSAFRELSVIHIDHFDGELEDIEFLKGDAIPTEIIRKIKGVFNDV